SCKAGTGEPGLRERSTCSCSSTLAASSHRSCVASSAPHGGLCASGLVVVSASRSSSSSCSLRGCPPCPASRSRGSAAACCTSCSSSPGFHVDQTSCTGDEEGLISRLEFSQPRP
ncbi:unnamed protein product, partial [Polarella glacialis]